MADVRREKELAERRKNEPQLGSSQDHLVRKIFSKFRRAQQTAITKEVTKDGSQNSDVEKGDTDPESKKVCLLLSDEGKVCQLRNTPLSWVVSLFFNTLQTHSLRNL